MVRFSSRHQPLLLAMTLFSVSQVHSQLLQGTLDGNVTDPSQAAVAGAKVTATDEQTNATRETLTNSAGGYTLPTLPPGTYTIRAYADDGILRRDSVRHICCGYGPGHGALTVVANLL